MTFLFFRRNVLKARDKDRLKTESGIRRVERKIEKKDKQTTGKA
jgi:hypothetical protein